MNPISRRWLLTAGLGFVAGCSTTKTFAGRDAPTATNDNNNDGVDDNDNDGLEPGDSTAQDDGEIDPRIVSVAVVGDSITDGSSEELHAALGDIGIDDVAVDGETSRRIENGSGKNGHSLSGIRTVQALLDEGANPSAWVVALGTNDVGVFGTAQDCADLIRELLQLLPDKAPLVWVNVYRPSDLDDTRVFNAVLERVLDDRGNAVVADWYSIASDPDADVLRGDDLHPNEEGQLAFAELVVQALQRL